VAALFVPLHDMVTGQPEKPAPLAGYLEALAKLQRQLQALSVAKWEPVRTYVSQVSNNVSGDEFHDAYRAAQSLNERSSKVKWTSSIGPLLEKPIRQAWALLIRDAGTQLDARWKTQIAQSFDSEVAGMYPFKPDGPDLPIAALSKYFKPGGGILADFYEKEMRPLEAPSDVLGRQPAVFTTIEFSREFQDFMQRVKIIRETFFTASPAEPVLAFKLTTPEGIKGLEQSTLFICDETWPYLNGPEEQKDFIWPGKSGCSRARISIRTFSKEELRSASFDGEWALFKLLKDAHIRPSAPATYTVTWSITATGERFDLPYKLKLNTTQNPFTHEFFTGVRCPERVTS
jgi:type VI secretion system protein ImpL